ncbi:MAG: hypothetical protein ACLP8A_17840 [Methylovirgula sp.]
MTANLPAPTEGAVDIAKVTGNVLLVVLGILSQNPDILAATTVAQPVYSCLVDWLKTRRETTLLKRLQAGEITLLSQEQLTAYIPMAYKFFEAVKEGEYQHNLEILASYITNELKQDIPDPAGFLRMARRIEGLSKIELKIIVQIDAFPTRIVRGATDAPTQQARGFVSASILVDKI